MPGRLVLEVMTGTGDWIDWGLYNAADFARDEGGAYFCQGDGSPLWLRCRRQDGSVLYVASSVSENLCVAFAGGKSSCERTGSSRLQRGSRDGMRIPLGAGERVAVREEQLVDSGLGLPELMA